MKTHTGREAGTQASIQTRRKVIAAAVFPLFCAGLAHGATFTWTGNTDTTWSNAADWTPTGGPPNSGSTAILATLATNQPNLTANAQLGTLLITTTSGGWTISDTNTSTLSITGTGVPINGSAVVSGTMTFSTNLQVSGATQNWAFGSSGTTTYVVDYSGNIDLDGHTLSMTANTASGGVGDENVIGNIISSASGSAGNITYAGSASARASFTVSGSNTYVGNTIISQATVFINSLALTGNASSLGGGGTVQIGNNSSNANLEYNGSGGTSDHGFTFYDQGTQDLYNNGTGPITLSNTGSAIASVGTGNLTLALNGTNNASNPAANANVLAESISNGQGGSTTLQKAGTNAWQLTNTTSSFTGPVNINVGTLIVDNLVNGGANSELGAGTTITLGASASTGILDYVGTGGSSNRSFALNGAGTAGGTTGGAIFSSGSGAIDLTSTGTLTAATATLPLLFTLRGTNTGNNTFSEQIVNGANSGATVGLLKTDSGTWILANNVDTYTGQTTIAGGVLGIGADGAINSGGPLGVAFTGGTLQFDNYASSLNFANDAKLSLGAAAGAASTLNGTISGTSALNYIGPGTLDLTASNNYSGGTTLGAGVLNFDNIDNLGSGTIVFTGGTLQYATGNIADVSTLPMLLGAGGGTIDTNGNNVKLSNSIGDGGAGGLTKAGADDLELNAAETYTGDTTAGAGTLEIGPLGSVGSANISVSPGAVLTIDAGGAISTSANLTVNGTYNENNSIRTINTLNGSGTATLNGATLTVSGGGSFSGKIADGTAPSSIVAAGGTLSLSGSNTYSGGTTVSGGTLRTASNSALGTGPVLVSSPGILDLDGNAPTIGNLSGSGTIDNVSAGGSATLAITTSTSSNFSGTIQNTTGSVALSVSGTGTQILSGVNSYTGGTAVSAGKLLIAPTSSTTSALPTGELSITGSGEVQLEPNVTAGSANPTPPPATSNVNITSLSITGSGVLDITNNHIIIDYTPGNDPINSIAAMIASGYAGDTWSGPGIISSLAATNPSYGLGYADSADPGNPAGLASNTIEVMYTLLGDANLDGKVNGSDFTLMAANFNDSVTNGWDEGDFNYSGTVNGDDFVLLADNFNQFASQSSISSADLQALDSFAAANGISLTSVPEPATMGLLTLGIAGVLARRRRV